MEYISLIAASAAITIIGSILKVILPFFGRRRFLKKNEVSIEVSIIDEPESVNKSSSNASGVVLPNLSTAQLILIAFSVIVFLFGVFTLIRYWEAIKRNEDSFYFIIWLLISMIAGMFVQVLATNYKAGHPLFQVGTSELIFPLLFSVIVFYPVWAIGASAEHSFFSVHAAFLNGYFWESVVSSAKPPEPQ